MKRWITAVAIAAAVSMLACGGGDDKKAAQAPAAAAEAPAAAAKAPAAAAKAPAAAAEAPVAAAPSAPAEEPAVSAAPTDATASCLALAAQQKWSEALAPCTEAVKAHPTDLRLKHAMQQAQAAAEG